ncbi:MAG: hypothetical protein R3F48_08535 [Candidatus Zixiibacteriota bacterium]
MSKEKDKKEQLARKIAKLFKEEDSIKLYEYTVNHYKESAINKALDETMKVPNDRIKKSRSALFFHLLKKYDKE